MQNLLVLYVATLGACSQAGAQKPPQRVMEPALAQALLPETARAEAVRARPTMAQIPASAYPGTVAARRALELAARGGGRLERIDAALGHAVTRGEILARFDTRALRAELQTAQAQQEQARAELNRQEVILRLARARAARIHNPALQPHMVAAAEIEKADGEAAEAAAQLDAARAAVAERLARIEQIRVQLDDAEIRAPFNGAIAGRYVEAGAAVPGGTPLLRLISDQDLLVRFAVSAEAAMALTAGQRLVVWQGEGETEGPAVAAARVERVAPEVDGASQRVTVEATLDPAGASRLRAGSKIYVRLEGRR
ncbi:MAG: efflux RND transporter periplasmic adaptor subunit [Polyangia bacterium]